MQTPPVPRGLSPRSRAIWRDLVTEHTFENNELVSLRRALEWFDRSDALIASAEGTTDARERAALLKQAMDASNCGLRYWRVLKFVDPVLKPRPGASIGRRVDRPAARASGRATEGGVTVPTKHHSDLPALFSRHDRNHFARLGR